MKYKLGSLTRYLVLFVITLSLLWFAFRGIDLNKLFSEILRAKISWVALSGIFSLVAFLVRGYRWKLLIEPLGYSPSLKNTTYSVMIGYFANLALPRLGEVTRCGALSKTESIPFNKLLGTVIVERLIDVLSLLICILLAAAIEYKRLGDFFYEKIFNPLAEKLKLVMQSPLLLALMILLMIVLIGFAIYFFRKSRGSESKVTRLIIGFVDGLKSIGRLKRPWAFIFQSAFIWVLYYLGVYTALFAFDFTSALGGGTALFLLVAGGVGMSAPVQGGIGAYHLLVKEGLVLYGVSEVNGLAFAFMLHGLQMVLVIILGAVSMFLLFSARRNKEKASVSAKT